MSVERFHRGVERGRSPFNRWPTLTGCISESRGARRCQLNDSIGALEGEEPFNRCTILTHCAGESRGARRCQFNDSIGALELPKGASALTDCAVFE